MSIKDIRSRLYHSIYTPIMHCCEYIFHYLPVASNKIVFIQSEGGGYKCNLKYVAQEIIRQKLPYDLVWLLLRDDENIPSIVRKVRFNRIRAVYELSTAKVVITNSKSHINVRKKSSQCFIYIPHGQPGCKCAEGDGNLPERYIKMSQHHSSITDIFVSMGTYHTQVLKDTFWVPESAEILECGFPRNDNFYRDMSALQHQIRKRVGVPEGYKVVLYAPTFRDNGKTDAYNLDLNRLLDTLNEKTGDKWLMFITLHPCFIWFKHPPYEFGKRVWNMSNYKDIHELMLIVDVVISDYSSVALDFANTRRPVFLYASDIDEYTQMRGLKEMYYHLPFTLCRNNDEMAEAIANFNEVEYEKRLNAFNAIYGSFDDGHASERFVKRLTQIFK